MQYRLADIRREAGLALWRARTIARVGRQTRIHTAGYLSLGGFKFRDWNPNGFGPCNILCGFGNSEIARALLVTEETVKKRLDVYVAQTKPLIEYYNNWAQNGDPATSLTAPQYRRISGLGSVDEIRNRAFDALK